MKPTTMATHFEATPNEVIISGAERTTLPAQRLVIADDGVHVVARGGILGGSREIDLSFAAVVDVRYEEAITYELVVETDDATYTVTNVTGDEEEADAMVRVVADRAGIGPTSSSVDADGRPTVSDGGDTSTGVGTDTADARAAGETDVARQLREFAQLRDDGIITDEEFERKKRDLLEDN